MCGNLKLQNTPHPINPWFLLRLRLQNRYHFSHSIPWLSFGRTKCVNREIDSWLRGLKCNRTENGIGKCSEKNIEKLKKSNNNIQRVAECGQTKGIRVRSRRFSIYYAINDHALLKSCMYSVSVSLFMFFFYGKIITDFARWSFRRLFFFWFHGFFFHPFI